MENNKSTSMDEKRQRKLTNLRHRMRGAGYLINDEVKVVVLPAEEDKRSQQREQAIKKFGYDLQNNLFSNGKQG